MSRLSQACRLRVRCYRQSMIWGRGFLSAEREGFGSLLDSHLTLSERGELSLLNEAGVLGPPSWHAAVSMPDSAMGPLKMSYHTKQHQLLLPVH